MTEANLPTPDQQVDISIVITCYNEEGHIVDSIENVIAALEEVGKSFEILVIEDASQDQSAPKIQEYLDRHPGQPITLKINKQNRGLANNYVEAAFLARGKYYRLCCGDNPEPKEILVNVFKHIGKADMVVPFQEQKNVLGKSPARKLLSNTFTFLVNTISGHKIKYYNGLAIHLRYNVLRWHPSSYGFGFQADIITRLLDEGATYMQIPSSSVDRKGGASSAMTLRNTLSVGHTLLELAIRRLRRLLYGHNSPKAVEIVNKSE